MLEKVGRYLQLMRELDLKLIKAVDTHLHADHITGLGALRDKTRCITVMGAQSKADVVSMRLADGDRLTIEGLVFGGELGFGEKNTNGEFNAMFTGSIGAGGGVPIEMHGFAAYGIYEPFGWSNIRDYWSDAWDFLNDIDDNPGPGIEWMRDMGWR